LKLEFDVINLINIFCYLGEIRFFLIQEGGCLHRHCHETIKSHLSLKSHDVRCRKYDNFQKKIGLKFALGEKL